MSAARQIVARFVLPSWRIRVWAIDEMEDGPASVEGAVLETRILTGTCWRDGCRAPEQGEVGLCAPHLDELRGQG